MLPLITFLVGLFVLFKGGFTLGNRTVTRAQARSIGLILMAPLVIEFCASSMLIYNYIDFNADGSFSLSPDALDYISGTLGMIELVTVIAAVGLVLFNIYGVPHQQQGNHPLQPPKPQQPVPMVRVPDIMTVAEAAAYMRVSETELLSLIDQGKLGAARIGGSYRIARIAIDDFMAHP